MYACLCGKIQKYVIEFLSLFIHLRYEKEKNDSQEKIFLYLALFAPGNTCHTISYDLADESGKKAACQAGNAE